MKIFPPEPETKIYEQGFDADDILDRAPFGRQLSDFVERVEQPLVIAIDGEWGCGKSFFLKRWVGAHTLQNEGTATTVYFDAFEHDFLDDPLTSILGVMSERFEGEEQPTGTLQKIKETAFKFAKPAFRIGIGLATAGGTEAVGAAMGGAIKAASEELQDSAENYWKKEEGKRAAMAAFKTSLAELTAPEEEDGEPNKIIIVIDELDRCRPDYALQILEIMKHFFAVPHVHFVLGVNLTQLENSVHARYGSNMDARLYLQKFITLTMSLPKIQENDHQSLVFKYFNTMAVQMGLDRIFIEAMLDCLKAYAPPSLLTLRGMQKILTEMALTNGNVQNDYHQPKPLINGLIILKIDSPKLYKEFLNGTIDFKQIQEWGNLGEPKYLDNATYADKLLARMCGVWMAYIDPKKFEAEAQSDIKRSVIYDYIEPPQKSDGISIANKMLETIKLPSELD